MKKILLIDDEPTLTEMIKLNLDRTGKFEVFVENSGPDAIGAVRKYRPDIIFLDVMMPGKSGDDIAQELHQDAELSAIPIVFLTAILSKEETDTMGSVIGGNRFLAKPVKISKMLAVIEELTANTGKR